MSQTEQKSLFLDKCQRQQQQQQQQAGKMRPLGTIQLDFFQLNENSHPVSVSGLCQIGHICSKIDRSKINDNLSKRQSY